MPAPLAELVGMRLQGRSEWTCEGSPKFKAIVGAYGGPARYQQGCICKYAKMSGRFYRQFGWYRRS
jgi:hypothetical protein